MVNCIVFSPYNANVQCSPFSAVAQCCMGTHKKLHCAIVLYGGMGGLPIWLRTPPSDNQPH